jgi:hypothetical protein
MAQKSKEMGYHDHKLVVQVLLDLRSNVPAIEIRHYVQVELLLRAGALPH